MALNMKVKVLLFFLLAVCFTKVTDGSTISNASNTSNKTTKKQTEAFMVNEIISNDTNNSHHGKHHHHHHHERVQVIIPADERLEANEFPEEVEEELGHAKLGKNSSKRKLKLKKFLAAKNKRNVLKDMEEELIEAENELDDPSLVVTEDSRVDFSTDIIDTDGNVIHEEVHSHHLRKLGNVLSGTGHVLNHKKFGRILEEPKNNVERVEDSDSSESFDSLMTQSSVVEKMIRLRALLDEAIEEFHLGSAKSKRSNDNASPQQMDLLRDALQQVSKDKRFILRRKRDHADVPPINTTCIYVDIPGQQPDTEVEPYFTDSNNYDNNNNNYEVEVSTNENYQSEDNYHNQETIHYDESKEDNENEAYHNQEEAQTSDTNNVNPIYWMHIPPEETIPNQEMFHELMEVVGSYHREGKDVIFVPVQKTHANSENEIKHSFLKGLHVNPVKVQPHANKLK